MKQPSPFLAFSLFCLLFSCRAAAQCLAPELALINSCVEHPNPNGGTLDVESELLVLSSGLVPVPVSTIGFDLPFNGLGPANADVGVDLFGNPLGCVFKEPTITSLPGCDNVIPLGPDDVIPPNSLVVFFTTGTTVTDDLVETDFANICPQGEPIYVLQSACERTAGAFANGAPASGDPIRAITVISPCGLRGFTYNTQLLDPAEGTYYLVGLNEFGNLNCDLPIIPETCPVIDTTFVICDPAGDLPAFTAAELGDIYPQDILSVSFHPTAVAAEGNDDQILSYQTTGQAVDTLYARLINGFNFCISVGILRIEYGDCNIMPIDLSCEVRNQANGSAVLGAITATITEGLPPFTVTLTDDNGGMTTLTDQSAGEVTFTGLPSGEYTIDVIDAAGQTATCDQEVIDVACPLTIAGINLFVSDCSGTNNTVISLDIAGFEPPLFTTWSGGAGIDLFNGMNEAGPLPPGTYFAEVSDGSGCPPVQTGAIVVEDRGALQADLVEVISSQPCATTGSVTIVPTGGGTPPYTVVLTDADGNELDQQTVPVPEDTVRFTGLAGTTGTDFNYGFLVRDDFGCATLREDFSIQTSSEAVLALPPADQSLVLPTCTGGDDGSISLQAAGGSEPYTYDWIDYPGIGVDLLLGPGPDQTGLPAGDYTIAITEAGGCADTLSVTLAEGNQPSLTCGPTTTAIGTTLGTVTLSLSAPAGPLTVTLISPVGLPTIISDLPPGDTTVTVPGPGDYQSIVTDPNGCTSDTCTFTIFQQPCDVEISANVAPVDCTGEGLIAVSLNNAAAPVTYAWSDPDFPPADTVRPVRIGDYGLTVTDANGCLRSTVFAVDTLDDGPRFLADPLTVLGSCTGDSVRVPVAFSASGPGPFILEYYVFGPQQPAVNQFLQPIDLVDTLVLPADYFEGTGNSVSLNWFTDQRCFLDIQETVAFYEQPRPDTVRRNDVTCRPEGVEIGGRLFTAAMPADTFLVDDGSECGIRYEVNLTFLAPEAPDTIEVFICPGTSFEVAETGDIFDADRPEGEVAYARPGQCDSLVHVRLDIPETFIGSFGASACAGDTIFVGDDFFTADRPSGIAVFPGEAANGCDSLVAVNVNFTRVGELRLLGDHSICPGDTLELRFAYDGQGGVNARLENLQGEVLELNNVQHGDRVEIIPVESTTWSIVFTERNGCPGTFTGRSEIGVSDFGLTTEVLTEPADFCNDTLGRGIALPSGGAMPYDISWSNGPTDSLNRNLLAGTYRVEVTDAAGCVRTDSIVINGRVPLMAELSTLPPACEGGRGRVVLDTVYGGSGFYEVSLDGSFFLPVDRIGDFRPFSGVGTAVIQDLTDCRIEVPFFVPGALRPTFNPLADTTIFVGDSILLDPQVSIPFDTAWWTPAGSLRTPNQLTTIALPSISTDYALEIRTADGCAFSYRVYVRVDERVPVYAPTAFSPNNDGTNDVYRLELGPRATAITSFQIFNRWGTLVHEGPDGWDGLLEGQPAQSAVYVFQAVVVLRDGTERFVKGDFVLWR